MQCTGFSAFSRFFLVNLCLLLLVIEATGTSKIGGFAVCFYSLIKQFSCGPCIWFVGFLFISPSAYVFSQASLGPAWGPQVQSVFIFFKVQIQFL